MTENQTPHEVTIPGPAAVKLRETVAALTRTRGFKGTRNFAKPPAVLKYVKLSPQADEMVRIDGSDRYMAFRFTAQARGVEEDWLLHAVTLEKALGVLSARDVKDGHQVRLSWRTNDGEKGTATLISAAVVDSQGETVKLTAFSPTPPDLQWAVLTAALAKEVLGSAYPNLPFPKNEDWRETFGADRVSLSGDMLLAMSRVMGEDVQYSEIGFHLTAAAHEKTVFGQMVWVPARGAYVLELESPDYTLLSMFMGAKTDR